MDTTLIAASSGDGRVAAIVGGAALFGFAVWLWRSRRAEALEAEKAKAHEVDEKNAPSTRFSDVAGCEEAVAELREVVQYVQDPTRFERLGAKLPRGALLVGPPGTGKTLLARAVAGEAGAAFFHHTGSDFVELYVGTGAKRIRELYEKANEAERAIVFIDEIDAIGKRRGNAPSATGSNEEQEHTLIALLNELDGFTGSNVFTICATNRADVLDPALTRPGRLERRITVPNPDRRGREAILRVHLADKPVARGVDVAALASRTPGVSGATLAAVVNEAALEAARRERDDIDASCLEHALSSIMLGRARHSAVVSEEDARITAWHEAGHTVCAKLLADAPDPAAASIIPRGSAGGVTWMLETDNAYMTRSAAKARLIVALGGRAAEEILLDGEFTQGAQADLATATDLATAMVRQYGMTERGLTHRPAGMFDPYDPETADAVERLLTEAMESARSLLRSSADAVARIAELLLAMRTIDADTIDSVFGGTKRAGTGSAAVLGGAKKSPASVPVQRRTGIRPRVAVGLLRIKQAVRRRPQKRHS